MAAAIQHQVTGVFQDREAAQRALADLERAGIRAAQVSVDVNPPQPVLHSPGQEETIRAQTVSGCAIMGVAAGALLGIAVAALLWQRFAFPVVLAVWACCSLMGWLGGIWLSRGRRLGYRGRETSGSDQPHVVVTVSATDRRDTALSILRDHGAQGHGGPLI